MEFDENKVRRVFELKDTAVNQEILAKRIADNLQKHQLTTPSSWPTFTLPSAPLSTETAVSASFLAALEQATAQYDKIWLDLAIPTTDNSFLTRLKRPFHQLVLFYVNKLGQRQIKFNDQLLRIIHQLVAAQNKKDVTIEKLQEQLTDLQKRIETLETGTNEPH